MELEISCNPTPYNKNTLFKMTNTYLNTLRYIYLLYTQYYNIG